MLLRKKISLSLPVLLFSFFLALNLTAQDDAGWTAPVETVEKMSKSRPHLNFREENVPEYTLPDVLTTLEGDRVTNARMWNQVRRPEILELYRTHIFGRVPETPYEKSFKVINLDKNALDGAATLKEVDVTITRENKSLVIHLKLFTPNCAALSTKGRGYLCLPYPRVCYTIVHCQLKK